MRRGGLRFNHRMIASFAVVAALLTGVLAPQDPAVDLRRLPGERTPIRVGLMVLDIMKIDDAEQVALVDLALRLDWHDERLEGAFEKVTELNSSVVRIPPVAVFNDRSLRRGLPEVASVFPNGDVRYVQRFTGEISVRLDLSEFPWDRETMEVVVVFPVFPDEAVLELNDDFVALAPELTIANWSMGEPSFEMVEGSWVSPDHFQLIYRQPMERDPSYYIWSVIVPLSVVVAMSWVAFWINPERVEAQLAVAATSMLSLVAFRFAVAQLVPPLTYLTRLDLFTIGCTALVFLALIEVSASSYLEHNSRHKMAVRLDVWSRWVFPVTMVLLLWIAFGGAGR